MADLNLPTPNKDPGDGAPADDINLVIEAINTLNSAVENISAGPQGPQGEPGTPGAAGANASVTVGSTTTGAAGSSASVSNSGTAQNAVFDFVIPRGEKGETGATGAQGAQGPQGNTGPQGPIGTVTPELEAAKVAAQSAASSAQASETKASEWADKTTGEVETGRYSAKYWAEQAADTVGGNFVTPDGPATLTNKTMSGSSNTFSDIAPASVTGTAVVDSDSRLTDTRTPTDGTVTDAKITAGGLSPSSVTGTAVITSDSRLSDERVPTDNSVTSAKIANGAIVDADINAAAAIAPTKINGTAVVDSDSRLTDARTPTAHATSHESGGSDALTLAQSQVTNLTSDLSGKALATDLTDHENATTSVHGISDTSNLVYTNDSRLSDARTPTAHASSHESGGSDELTLAQSQITNLVTDLAAKIAASIVNAKGDLIAATADNTVARVSVGTDGQALIADSGETAGVRWGTVATDPTPTALFLGGM